MDRDSFFVPAGYDSAPLLRDFDIQNELESLYEDRVPYIKPKNVIKEEEVMCEDVNIFLKKFVEKGKKMDGNLRRQHTDYTTEDNKKNNYGTEDRVSSNINRLKNKESSVDKLNDNFASNGKTVNFDIFNSKKSKNASIDLDNKNQTSGTSGNKISTTDRFVSI